MAQPPPNLRGRSAFVMAAVLASVVGCSAQQPTAAASFTTAVRSSPSVSDAMTVPSTAPSPATAATTASTGSSAPASPASPSSTLVVPSVSVAPPTIAGGQASGIDVVVRDAVTDIVAYWTAAAPEVFHGQLSPLRGGLYSVDPAAKAGRTVPCLSDPADVKGDVFYCPTADAIVYDRSYLARLAQQYSDLDVALTLAHEFGHALQRRFPTGGTKTITEETQADCYAGTWAAWLAGGNVSHVAFRTADLDKTLGDYVWEMGDPVGTDPNNRDAHGSVFDRISALQEGFVDGPDSCTTDFPDTRRFVSMAFTATDSSDDRKGNVPFATAISQGTTLLQQFWTAQFTNDGKTFTAPVVAVEPADCTRTLLIALCPDGHTLGLGPLAALTTNHDRFGDFSTVTALGVGYAEDVQDQGGLPAGPAARICSTGAFAASLFSRTPAVLSPGDLDEAVRFLLVAGPGNPVVDTGSSTAWDRLDAFRAGVLNGPAGCA